MKKIEEITEEIIAAGQNPVKITEILKENMMVSGADWNLRAIARDCSEYPCIDIYTCDKNGDIVDCVNVTEIRVEENSIQSFAFDNKDGYTEPSYILENAKKCYNVKVGDEFTIVYTDDNELYNWYKENEDILVVTKVDKDSKSVMADGCPYKISFDEIKTV